MKYLYSSHLGDVFETDDEIYDTFCPICGDNDFLIGTFETNEERDCLIREWNEF